MPKENIYVYVSLRNEQETQTAIVVCVLRVLSCEVNLPDIVIGYLVSFLFASSCAIWCCEPRKAQQKSPSRVDCTSGESLSGGFSWLDGEVSDDASLVPEDSESYALRKVTDLPHHSWFRRDIRRRDSVSGCAVESQRRPSPSKLFDLRPYLRLVDL